MSVFEGIIFRDIPAFVVILVVKKKVMMSMTKAYDNIAPCNPKNLIKRGVNAIESIRVIDVSFM